MRLLVRLANWSPTNKFLNGYSQFLHWYQCALVTGGLQTHWSEPHLGLHCPGVMQEAGLRMQCSEWKGWAWDIKITSFRFPCSLYLSQVSTSPLNAVSLLSRRSGLSLGKQVPAKPHQPVAGKTCIPHSCPFSQHWGLLSARHCVRCGIQRAVSWKLGKGRSRRRGGSAQCAQEEIIHCLRVQEWHWADQIGVC